MADTKISGLPAVTTPSDADEYAVNQVGVSKKITAAQIASLLFTRIKGSSGAAGAYKTLQQLIANSANQTSVTPGAVMTTTGVGVGTWHFKYTLIFQTAATTTGIRIANNHTGTVTTYIMSAHYVTTGSTAATGIHDGTSAVQAAGLNEGFAENVLNTSSKATAGVSTANVNKLIVVEGIMVVSVTGDLEFRLGTEVAGSAARLMIDSVLELTNIG